MYIFANRGAGMSKPKMAAQVAHAAVEAYIASPWAMQNAWYVGNHYTKVVLDAEDETHLHTIQKYLEERGFTTKLIIDEGRTEIRAYTATALGVEIVDKDNEHVAATFSGFKTYPKNDKAAQLPQVEMSATPSIRGIGPFLHGLRRK